MVLNPGPLMVFGFMLIVGNGVTANTFHSLYTELLADYNSEIIPRCSTIDNVTVTVNIALREVIDLNEVEQTLTLKIWMRLRWVDCGLKWNSTDYGGIDNLGMGSTAVWTPDITLYESVNEGTSLPGDTDYRIVVTNDGTVYYNFPSVVTLACRVDVTYFPYDSQNCSLKFGSWSQPARSVDTVTGDISADLDSFLRSNEWNIHSVNSKRHLESYECCPDPYSDVTFYLVISRKPKFFFLTLILPCILILILAALGLILPSESGEKMSLEVTVLLSLAVFLLLISDKLPAAAETFPIIGIYFTVCMALVTLSCVVSLVVLYMYFRDGSIARVPRILRKCCRISYCRRKQVLGLNDKETYTERVTNELQSREELQVEVIDKPFQDLKSTTDNGITIPQELLPVKEEISTDEIINEWHELARKTDKIILGMFIIVSTITTVIFLTILISQY